MATETRVESVTSALSEWVATLPAEAIPSEVRAAARWLILDHLACAIGGASLTPARIMLDLAREQGGAPQATVYATGERTSVLQATYLNCALSNLLDFDDTYSAYAHPGGTAISPAIAAAEYAGKSGAEVVTAVVLAYEVMMRIIIAAMPSPERYRQVAGLSVWQTLGAVVAAGRVLGLEEETMRHAFGLGGFNAPVPNMRKLGLEPEERPFSWTKNNYGWAAQGGLLGVLLAARGFQGSRWLLDGDRGFWVMAGSDRWDPDAVLAGLGESWLLPNTGFKPYAACRWTHTALDAVRRLRAEWPDVRPDQLRRIRLRTFYEVARQLSTPDPVDIIDAQFAVRHLMALEMLGRSAREGLREADLTDPEVVELRRRIEVEEDEELTAAYFGARQIPAVLEVETAEGQSLTFRVDDPWGNPANPFSEDDILNKYRSLTVPVIGQEASARLEQGILALDDVASLREILRGERS